jgi:hypothetical protein
MAPSESFGPNDDYPNTYSAAITGGAGVQQPRVFDPSLRQFLRAFRLGDPIFSDPDVAQRWRSARTQVMDHLLKIAAQSPWSEHLVLRGSLLLKAWLGAAAREPGDMDWVVTPKSVRVTDPLAREMIEGLVRCAAEDPVTGEALIDVAGIVTDDIWTYERAPGKRIGFPWQAQGVPPGVVQVDLVFEEELWLAPVLTHVPLCDGGTVEAWAASKELALAWKLLWLETDSYPQGKDLYDAVLLAEQAKLSLEILERILWDEGYPPARQLDAGFPLEWDVDWDNFKLEYPAVEGTARDWQERLAAALAPMFTARC